jgi:hypothetical protein
VKWFGKTWGAPVCEESDHVATPVGSACTVCGQEVIEGQRGLLLPFCGNPGDPPELPYHLQCFLASVGVGQTVHILYEGLPLCGFTTDVPAKWPPRSVWVRLEEKLDANCGGCLVVAAKRAS